MKERRREFRKQEPTQENRLEKPNVYEIGPVTVEATDYLTQLAIWKVIFIHSDSSDRVPGKKFKCKGTGK